MKQLPKVLPLESRKYVSYILDHIREDLDYCSDPNVREVRHRPPEVHRFRERQQRLLAKLEDLSIEDKDHLAFAAGMIRGYLSMVGYDINNRLDYQQGEARKPWEFPGPPRPKRRSGGGRSPKAEDAAAADLDDHLSFQATIPEVKPVKTDFE